MAGKFYYFAYGSNLLKERIRLNNPSAVFKAIGKLHVGVYLWGRVQHRDNSLINLWGTGKLQRKKPPGNGAGELTSGMFFFSGGGRGCCLGGSGMGWPKRTAFFTFDFVKPYHSCTISV